MNILLLIGIAIAIVLLVNILFKSVAFIIRLLVILAVIIAAWYFLKDTVVGLLVR